MLLLTIYVSIAIGVSFICSVLEAVLLSISPSYIAQLKQNGHPAAESLDKLKTDIDRPLASILTLNTIAHTIGAATAGAQAAVVFGSQWLGVFSAVLTLGILVLSEIVPKPLVQPTGVNLLLLQQACFVGWCSSSHRSCGSQNRSPNALLVATKHQKCVMSYLQWQFWQKRAVNLQKVNQKS